MDSTVSEIAEGIYRISTFVPQIGPDGMIIKKIYTTKTTIKLLTKNVYSIYTITQK